MAMKQRLRFCRAQSAMMAALLVLAPVPAVFAEGTGALDGQDCAPQSFAAIIAEITATAAEEPDQDSPEQFLFNDFSGDGVIDLVTVSRIRTEGGASDAASVSFRLGGATGICAQVYDMALDAGAGAITLHGEARPENLPDFVIDYHRNHRETGPDGITDTTRPERLRFRYDAALFAYVAEPAP